MPLIETLIGPIAALIDKLIPDPKARDAAKLELIKLQGAKIWRRCARNCPRSLPRRKPPDPWTSRARPSFLYVMYVIILWSLPMGLIAAFRPQAAADIAAGMNAYLAGLPEPLYALVWHRLSGLHRGAAMGQG